MELKFNGHANKAGVYVIRNMVNERVYYGSSNSFKDRAHSHRNSLVSGKHQNQFLQADFNKCGSEVFVFEVVEVVDGTKEERLAREQVFLDTNFDDCKQCYNLRPDACDSREGVCNHFPTNPLTDKRCQSPSPLTREKRGNAIKQAFVDHPELRQACSDRANAQWAERPSGLTFTNKTTGEVVTVQTSLRKFCEERNLNYKAFHLLASGKSKSSGGWYLGTHAPEYVERKGEKRKPLTSEHRAKIAGNKYSGIVLANDLGDTLVLGNNIKEMCREHKIDYTTLLKVVNGACKSVNGFKLQQEPTQKNP